MLLPILLPNSAYMARNGYDPRGHGVMPMFLGANRIEVQVTLNGNEHASSKGGPACDSIAGKCSLMIHEVQMTNGKRKHYQDQRAELERRVRGDVCRGVRLPNSGGAAATGQDLSARYNEGLPRIKKHCYFR